MPIKDEDKNIYIYRFVLKGVINRQGFLIAVAHRALTPMVAARRDGIFSYIFCFLEVRPIDLQSFPMCFMIEEKPRRKLNNLIAV